MKLLFTLLLLLIAGRLCAQRVTGMVMGELTRMPLPHATVAVGSNTVQTNAYGIFTISMGKPTDSIRINCAGYDYYAFKPAAARNSDTLVIYLQPVSYKLKEVVIKSQRNVKADSLRNRRDFANVFNYKPSIGDVMITYNPSAYVPYNYIDAPNSTANIVGFDVLRLISFLSKKKTATSRLQQHLLLAEANNYVEQKFSREAIMAYTPLKGNALETFMDQYRPTVAQAKKMSNYDMVIYIKKCYAEYAKQPIERSR
ncbi:MAG: hypothetical protein V4592_25780 [Bacteroidota bacterium]